MEDILTRRQSQHETTSKTTQGNIIIRSGGRQRIQGKEERPAARRQTGTRAPRHRKGAARRSGGIMMEHQSVDRLAPRQGQGAREDFPDVVLRVERIGKRGKRGIRQRCKTKGAVIKHQGITHFRLRRRGPIGIVVLADEPRGDALVKGDCRIGLGRQGLGCGQRERNGRSRINRQNLRAHGNTWARDRHPDL